MGRYLIERWTAVIVLCGHDFVGTHEATCSAARVNEPRRATFDAYVSLCRSAGLS